MSELDIKVSQEKYGLYAVFGHVGVGHVHSHSSYVQDDSVGFAVISYIMRKALGVDTRIKEARADIKSGRITIVTYSGGIGEAYSRRGINPWEEKIIERAVGEDGIYTQNIPIMLFGRMYGQGVTTTPVALQGAIALAVLNSFEKASGKIITTTEKYPNQIDRMAAIVVDINGVPVSLMAVVNGSEGGIGPNEDNEGNTTEGPKGKLIEKLKMMEVPSIIVESKAYIPRFCKDLKKETFFIRAEKNIDNTYFAEKLAEAARTLNVPFLFEDNVMSLEKDQMKRNTMELADKIITLGKKLKEAQFAEEKVETVFNLSKLVSEDAGGVTFMSNSIHDKVRSAGIVPGKTTILSMIVSKEYIDYWGIPMITEDDIVTFVKIIEGVVR